MKTLLKQLCDASGVGGVGNVADEIALHIRDFCDDVHTDALGNLVGIRRCNRENAPLLMLEAHMDEIGFVVTHVDDGGFVHVSNCGGIDGRVLAATVVTVLADTPLTGVFCSTPPHLASGEKKLPVLEDRGIDVGLSAEEAKARIPVGTRVMFSPRFDELGEHCVTAKALDNRAGCAAVIRALQMLKDEQLFCDVAVVFAVQEEVGGAGALVASYAQKPDASIVIDVSFALTPDAPAHECGELGKGPMLGVSPILDRNLTRVLEALASQAEIAIQYEAMGECTGTDADKISCVCDGVPTALLSIPLRYMHTPMETVDVRDVEASACLMAQLAKKGEISRAK